LSVEVPGDGLTPLLPLCSFFRSLGDHCFDSKQVIGTELFSPVSAIS